MVETEGQLRRRLLGEPPGQVLFGWLGPLIAAVIGGILRFWNLGDPHQLVFDETYYVKQGWSMILFGVEMRNDPVLNEAKQIDQNFTAGNVLKVYDPTTGDLVVHPPVGKWLIGWGEQLFGIDNSFGWRFAVCVMGVLSIFMIGRAARRLFGSSLLGTVAALVLAFEGHHFVHSRTGLLDLILMFWAFAAFCFLLIDRDQSRKILARKVAGLDRAGLTALGPWGPSTGWRPWRLAAGVCLGLACGTKWSGAYFLVVFGLMTVLWDMGARRAVGITRWKTAWLVKDTPLALLWMVGTTVVVYCLSWWGWFATEIGYNRHWADTHPADPGWGWVPDSVRSWWNYHAQILEFHTHLTSDHPYKTNPWSWLIQGRPTSFFYEGPNRASRAVSSRAAPRRSPRSGRRRSGGAPPSRCSSCSSCGRCAATGGPARSWPGSWAGTCRGSSSATGPSTPSTRWPSCPTSSSPASTCSGCSSVARPRDRCAGRWGSASPVRSWCSRSSSSRSSGRSTRPRSSRTPSGAPTCGSPAGSEQPPDLIGKWLLAYGGAMEDGLLFRALADETRRVILDELTERDGQSLFELCSRLTMRHGITSTRQAISQHLAVLEEAGLVTSHKDGRTKLHHLDTTPLQTITARWPLT